MVGASAHVHVHVTRRASFNILAKYSTTSSILFEHRGEGTNLEFGKLSVVPISQRHRTGGLWRTRKTFGASSRNENAFL